jgi:hypothetical protein
VVKRVVFAVPGDLATPTGGYAYDRRMIAELQRLGWQVDVAGLGDGFPYPSADTKASARDSTANNPHGTMTPQQESTEMPKAGQANNYSSPALDKKSGSPSDGSAASK